MKFNVSPRGAWLKMGAQTILAALVLTAIPPRVALAQPSPSASPSPPSPPPSSEATAPAQPFNRAPLEKMLGRQVSVQSGSQEIKGKLVELSDTSAVIEKDGGERVTIAFDQITAAQRRFSQPSPASSSQPASPDEEESATADTDSDDAWTFHGRRRVFGIGTAFGGGAAATTISSSSNSGVSPALLLPTLEVQFFTSREYSIDVTIPLANMVLVSEALGGFIFTTDTFFNVNVGSGSARLVAGPGLGFSFAVLPRGSAGSFRLPAEVGLEVLNKKRSFGFKLLARPWAEFASGSAASGIGGGVLGMIGFYRYSTTM